MIALLCSPSNYKDINDILDNIEDEIGLQRIEESIDPFKVFEEIKRLPLNHVIIDITAFEDTKSLESAIFRYRLLNDKTHFVIIASDIKPPNQLLNKLVKMGIYSIISVSSNKYKEELEQLVYGVLETPYTYKKAVRWTDNDLDDIANGGNNTENEIHVREKVIEKTKEITKYKNVSLENKNVIIAGLHKGAGASFIASNIAKYISDKSIKTSLIEIPGREPFLFEFLGLDARLKLWDESDHLTVLNDIKQGEFLELKFKSENNLNYIVQDPRVEKIKAWDYTDTSNLLLSLNTTVNIIDGDIDNPNLEKLKNLNNTILLLVTDSLPIYFNKSLGKLKDIIDKKGTNVYLIINRNNPYLKEKEYIKILKGFDNVLFFPYIEYGKIYKASFQNRLVIENREIFDDIEDDLLKIVYSFMDKNIVEKNSMTKKNNILNLSPSKIKEVIKKRGGIFGQN